jgi:hypothetical protein
MKEELHRRAPLASAGMFHFVCEFKRKLVGFPLWKTIIFHVLMKANRIASTKLKLPTVIRYDGEGAFWTEYCGGFTDLLLAQETIEQMRAERKAEGKHSQFELTHLPLNGVLPERTDRYTDQDFPGEYLPEFYRANTGMVMCPHKRTLCNPDEVITRTEIEPLFIQIAKVDAAVS